MSAYVRIVIILAYCTMFAAGIVHAAGVVWKGRK